MLVAICSLVNAIGVDALKTALRLGVAAEAIASVGIGLALLLVFREQDFSVLVDTFGAEALSGGSTFAALLAALAVGGWAFIGFDATVAAAEETRGAAEHVPRAIWIALLSVGGLVILNAFATTLAHPDPAAVAAGQDIDPVSTAVVASFGDWSSKPFAAIVLVAFLACGMAAQGATARGIYSMARDGVLPGSRLAAPRRPPPGADRRDRRRHADRLGRPAARPRGDRDRQPDHVRHRGDLRFVPADRRSRHCSRAGRASCRARGWSSTSLAVAWLAFETVNIAWPRASLAPLGAPWYQVWAAPMVVAAITVIGLAYLVLARPTVR